MHPSRPPSPKLRRFAAAVRQAQAEARIGAEIRVYREQPRYWLTHAARTEPQRLGWTKPAGDQEFGLGQTLAERLAEIDEMERREGRAGESD